MALLNFNTNANGQNKWQAALGQGGTSAAPAAPPVSAPPVQAPPIQSTPHYTTNYTGGMPGLAKDPVTGLNQFQQNQKNSQAAAAAAGGYKPPVVAPPAVKAPVTTTAPPKAPLAPVPTYHEQAQTNYGGSGSALNEILFSKKQYDAGNKGWASSNANQYYSQLSPQEAALVKGMNTQQLIDYINSQKGGGGAAPGVGAGGAGPVSGVGTALGNATTNGVQTNPNTGITSINKAPNEQPLAQTVGNSYNNVNPTTGFDFSPGATAGIDPAAAEKAFLQQQIDALNGQKTSAFDTTNAQVEANKKALQEQLDSLAKTNAVQTDATQQFNNRLGGLYSGGQQYQQGEQAAAYANQQGALARDTSTANQNLIKQYGDQAATIANQIQQLQTAAPDIIREKLQTWIDNERNYGLDYANLFGNLNGQNTQSQNNQNFQQGIDVANLTGQYGGNTTLAGQQQALAEKQANWNAYMDIVSQTGNLGAGPSETWGSLVKNANLGADTLAGQKWSADQKQQIFDNNLNIQKFEEDKKQNGLQYALQQNAQALASDDNARQWAALDFDQAANSSGNTTYQGLTPNQVVTNIGAQFTVQDPSTKKNRITSDPTQRQAMFDQVINGTEGMSNAQVNQILTNLGLTKAEIDKFAGSYAGK